MRKLRMSELGRLENEDFKAAQKHPFSIALDDVRSLLNVGSVFRSADAFRCTEIILGGLSAEPSREMQKTALGAQDTVAWRSTNNLPEQLKALKAEGHKLFAVEQTDESLKLQEWQIPWPDHTVLVFGHEVSGVSDACLALCDGALEIPQFGTKHSLNIAVSAGLVMWEYTRQYLKKAR